MGLFSRRKDVSELAAESDVEGLVKVIAKDEERRAAAVEALVGLGDPSVLPPLLELLEGDNEPAERDAAFAAIRGLGPEVVTEPLVAGMEAGSKVAGWALGALGAPAVDTAKNFVARGEPTRPPGYFALASAGTDEAADALAAGIRRETDRPDALLAAGHWLGEEAVVIEALFATLREIVDTPLEGAAELALQKLAGRIREDVVSGDVALPTLAGLLRDADVAKRAGAAKMLYWVYHRQPKAGVEGERDPRTVDALAEACGDPEPIVRNHAAVALACQGDRRSTPTLIEMLGSDDKEVLFMALGALEHTRDPAAYQRVHELHNLPAKQKPGAKAAWNIGLVYQHLKEAKEAEESKAPSPT